LKEFTSSGLTHGIQETGNFGNLHKDFYELFSPKTYDFVPKDSFYDTSRFYKNNIGLIDFYFGSEGDKRDYVEWKILN